MCKNFKINWPFLIIFVVLISQILDIYTEYPRLVTMAKLRNQLKDGQYPLDEEQVRKLINTAPNHRDRLIILLLARAGLRRTETAQLSFEEVDMKRKRLNVIGKGDKRRMVPMIPELYQAMQIWIAGRKKKGWVIQAKSDPKAPISEFSINKIVNRIGERAGLKNPNPRLTFINPHCLRHTFARFLKDRGVSMEALKDLLGHESIVTTMDVYGLKSVDVIEEEVLEAFS